MNKQQKEVIQSQLKDEKETLRWLEAVYRKASDDCAEKIRELSARQDMENLQSIVYQKQYQQAIKNQIDATLDQLHSDSFVGISDYLSKCYESGYVGAMYDLKSQGIPIIQPIDQKQVIKAIQTDSKLSQSLYNRLGEDVTYLKKAIRSELSRGIVEGKSYNEIAEKLAKHMEQTPFNKAKNNAMRIARTEGGRIQSQAQMDAMEKAKSKGADIVKQWDATLDGRTRETHRELDGQIRELDEDFIVPSTKSAANAPRMFGIASEDCNCRCQMLQRARWALDDKELEQLQKRAEYFGIDKSEQFDDFKKKYVGITEDAIDKVEESIKSKLQQEWDSYQDKIKEKDNLGQELRKARMELVDSRKIGSSEDVRNEIKQRIDSMQPKFDSLDAEIKKMKESLYNNPDIYTVYQSDIRRRLEKSGLVKYNDVKIMNEIPTDVDIIKKISGGDLTKGSCSSLAFSYAGNKNGFDVVDFRGGESCNFFMKNANIIEISKLPLVNTQFASNTNDYKAANELLSKVVEGKEYYFATGKHAAVVRIDDGVLQYLELQSGIPSENGWHSFTENGSINKTLKERFACQKSHSVAGFKLEDTSVLIDIDSFNKTDEFRKILGYINTNESDQKKGSYGGKNNFYKNEDSDKIWWVDNIGTVGEFLFSFDKKTVFNLFEDYPHKLTPEQKKTFDEENPYWANFFRNRS